MLRKPRRLGLLVIFTLTLILGFKTVPSAITRYPYAVHAPMGETTKAELDFAPPLQTAGRHIVDANGKRYKLASINWYGGSDIFFVPMGLDVRHRSDIAKTIKKMGFNSVRFPYSDQMVLENPVVDPKHLQANLDLLEPYYDGREGIEQTRLEESASGPRALDVFNACVTALTDEGITVIPNNHITNAAWCDGKNLCDSSWKNSQYGPICKIYQTTESWIENWKTIMRPFTDNPLVIGADLRNEPRGLWGTMTWSMWASAAEQASEALLAMQPNWLMFVEGVSSANDCSGALTRPIQLSIPDRVVYSSHVYSWSGWGSLVPYHKRPYPSFAKDMENNWAYLLRSNTAPVWVGEFGVPHNASEGDLHYWNHLLKFLRDVDADFGYWALNPRKPEKYDDETYGLLEKDWETVVEDYRMKGMRELMGK
jgi:endoglucanase